MAGDEGVERPTYNFFISSTPAFRRLSTNGCINEHDVVNIKINMVISIFVLDNLLNSVKLYINISTILYEEDFKCTAKMNILVMINLKIF